MKKSRSGFTIVELLIVIVVIGILAAITVVAYNGIQERAQISTAQAELSNIAKAAQLYYVENNRYPNQGEWSEVLKAANMYENTRDINKKSFMICRNATEYAIVASTPILEERAGVPHYFVSSLTGGVSTFEWNTAITGTYTINRGCNQTPLPNVTQVNWSHSI